MVLFAAAVLLVGFGLLLTLGSTRTEEALTSGKVVPLHQLGPGDYGAVRGTLAADGELEAPLSGGPCVFWRLYFYGDRKRNALDDRDRSSNVELYRTELVADGLRVRSGQDALPLDTQSAELHVKNQHRVDWSLLGTRGEELVRQHAYGLDDNVHYIVEHRFDVGERVTVVGHVHAAPNGRYLGGPDMAVSALDLKAQRSRSLGTRIFGGLIIAGGLVVALAMWESARQEWQQNQQAKDSDLQQFERQQPRRLREHRP